MASISALLWEANMHAEARRQEREAVSPRPPDPPVPVALSSPPVEAGATVGCPHCGRSLNPRGAHFHIRNCAG